MGHIRRAAPTPGGIVLVSLLSKIDQWIDRIRRASASFKNCVVPQIRCTGLSYPRLGTSSVHTQGLSWTCYFAGAGPDANK